MLSSIEYPMAFTAFEEESASYIGSDLLWAGEYLDEHPKENGKCFTVHQVKLAKSGKGYVIWTDHFLHFIWKKSKTTQNLLTALKTYADTTGYMIQLKLDKNAKEKCVIGVDFEFQMDWFELSGGVGFTTTEEKSHSTVESPSNPFLPPVPFTPVQDGSLPNEKPDYGISATGKNTGRQRNGSQKPQ